MWECWNLLISCLCFQYHSSLSADLCGVPCAAIVVSAATQQKHRIFKHDSKYPQLNLFETNDEIIDGLTIKMPS